MRIAFFGGVYNNYLALQATFQDARRRDAEALYCLGDIGGFGPHPNRSLELLRDAGIDVVQGNYDHSIGHQLDDCGCGYTDPRDNHYARISYQYTRAKTSPRHLQWLRSLLPRIRVQAGALTLLLVHGSPRKVNEFLWESTTPDHLLEWMDGSIYRSLQGPEFDLGTLVQVAESLRRLAPVGASRGSP